MPHLTTDDGVKLYYEETGSGIPIVFVHEFAGDYRAWEPQVRYFSRRYRCITYNARGYPPSDVPKEANRYSQDRARDDIRAVLDALKIDKAHIVGLSMGGFAALHLGLRHPQLVRSLVVAGVGYGAKPEQQAEHSASSKRDADHAEAIGMAAFARNLAGSRYAQCLRAKDESAWLRFAERLAEHSVIGMAMTLRGVLATRPSLWHLADRLRGLDRPTLLVAGDEDTPCLEPGLFLKATLPDAAFCVMPRTGHLINLEEPSLFNTILFSFLVAVEHGRWSAWKGRALDRA